MKAVVDKDVCIGCGLCTSICSNVFEMDDDGKAIAKVDPVPSSDESDAQDAADSCPVTAITVE